MSRYSFLFIFVLFFSYPIRSTQKADLEAINLLMSSFSFFSFGMTLSTIRSHPVMAKEWALIGSGTSLFQSFLNYHDLKHNEEYTINDIKYLPDEIYELENINFKYVRSLTQNESECALYSVLNARAIQTVIEENKELNERNILHYSNYWLKRYKEMLFKRLPDSTQERLNTQSGLDFDDQRSLIRFFNLPHHHFFKFDFEGCIYGSSMPLVDISPNELYWVKDLDYLIKELSKQSIAHILLSSVSGIDQKRHAVLVSFIRYKQEKPLVIYMDSNNYSLLECDIYYVVPFFVTSFIKMLDKAFECM